MGLADNVATVERSQGQQAGDAPLTLRPAGGREDWEALERLPGATVYHSWRWLTWIAPLLDCEFEPLLVVQEGDALLLVVDGDDHRDHGG